MKVLVVHNRYRSPGGEEAVVARELALLSDSGLSPHVLELDSGAFGRIGTIGRLAIAARPASHARAKHMIRDVIKSVSPDVVHFHNLYPVLGPGAMAEAAALGCAVVQTLHNYRLSCVAGTHLREGKICELCRPGMPMPGVVRACYRGSRLQSWVIGRSEAAHWRLMLAGVCPDVTVCLSEFARHRLLEFGMRPESIVVKPNSTVPPVQRPTFAERHGVVFIGRLSGEKGVVPLVASWDSQLPLCILGDGPEQPRVMAAAEGKPVSILGQLSESEVANRIANARVLVFPSLWFEGLPTVVLEAYASGTPVVAFSHGVMTSIVSQRNLVKSGDFDNLVKRTEEVHALPQSKWEHESRIVLEEWASSYSPEANMRALADLYLHASAQRDKRRL